MFDALAQRFPRLLMARRNLLRARTRTALAILAIVIGVVAISSLGIFGVTFKAAQVESLGDIGSDVQVFSATDDRHFSERQMQRIDRLSGDAELVPIYRNGVDIQGDDERTYTTVYSVPDPGGMYEVRRGTIPGNWRKGALVGETLAQQYDLDPGDKIETRAGSFRVVAILANEGTTSIARPNDAIVLPREQYGTLFARGERAPRPTQVVVRADDADRANATAQRLRQSFNRREQRIHVYERAEFSERIDEVFWQVNMFLLGIGAISLLVAGVSIANVMLMSAIERREEIGVLRAVGYERLDVLRIMLAEAALLGVVGATIGVIASVAVGAVIKQVLLSDPWAFGPPDVQYAVVGFCFGVGVSVLGGLYPAWKASKARPVEALRS